MATSRSKKNSGKENDDEVPFVPDFALLDARKKLPTESEVIGIALALKELISHTEEKSSWETFGILAERERRL